jgi:triphosphatase
MHEIELKLQVPPARRAALDAAVAGRAPKPKLRLQAAYFDAPDRALAEAGLALRLRREGRQWVQTLKAAGTDGMTRAEHNVPRSAAAAMPAIDPSLHAGTPVGDRLIALLALLESGALLKPLYRTDVRRRTRVLVVRAPGAASSRVELAFDTGHIEAGDASTPVCEFEVEWLAGSRVAVIETARRFQARFGLWLDARSKAERGDLLARGEAMAAPRMAMAVRLDSAMDANDAWQAVLRNCADQIIVNASQIASGEHAAAHVHQLRVGLRRLRSAIALFEAAADARLGEGAAALFRALGAARDRVVIEGEFGGELLAAMRIAGLPAAEAPAAPVDAGPMPAALVRDAGAQALLFDLIEAMHTAPPSRDDDEAPLRERLAARLNHWHRQVAVDAKHYTELDDESRHRLRKRAKRLRYAAEFCAALFAKRDVRRYLKALRALQERLGAISDATMAMHAFSRRAPADPQAMFALGWLAARREALVDRAVPELKAFAKVDRFWKKRG